jgi:hypothetical protein
MVFSYLFAIMLKASRNQLACVKDGVSICSGRYARVEVHAHLDGFASGRSKVVPLQVGSLDACLSNRRSWRQSARVDQHRRCCDPLCL